MTRRSWGSAADIPVGLLDRLLTLYSWLAIGALIGMLALIARFYQLRSGERSHYRLFLIPLALLVIGGLLQALGGKFPAGEPASEALFCLGGSGLLGLGYLLLQLMTVRR